VVWLAKGAWRWVGEKPAEEVEVEEVIPSALVIQEEVQMTSIAIFKFLYT